MNKSKTKFLLNNNNNEEFIKDLKFRFFNEPFKHFKWLF